MRTMYWRPILLCCWLLVPGVQAVWAQGDPGGQYFYQQGAPPAMSGDPGGLPGYTGMGPAGYPPDAQAWPGTSMFRPGINQHYMQNGFWFNRIISGNSRFFFTTEALMTRSSAPPHHLIGSERVNPVSAEAADQINGGDHNQAFFETIGRPFSPDRSNTVTGNGGGGNGSNGTYDPEIFQTQDAGMLQQHFGSGGVRASWGWWNPDGSGFMAQGWWQNKARSEFNLNDPKLDVLLFGADGNLNFNFNALDRIQPWFGLPLTGTDRDQDGLNGVVVPYDLFANFRFWSQSFGGNLDWYFTPIYERDYLTIKPVAGVRYVFLNESFQFTGADSGMGYVLAPNQNVGGNNGGGNGTNNQNNTALVIQTLDPGFAIPDPFESFLLARSQSQFAGPEGGLRFDFGSKRTKIWLQSKFGLLAAYNTRSVNGYGIGDHYNILLTDPDVNGDGIPDNPLRAAGRVGSTFNNSTSTTTVSPMFEQGVFLQAPILSYIPIIKKMPVFDKADFQAGYTILMLGNVYRPTNNIEWQQYPNVPTVGNGRSLYYTSNWSVGVQWNY